MGLLGEHENVVHLINQT